MHVHFRKYQENRFVRLFRKMFLVTFLQTLPWHCRNLCPMRRYCDSSLQRHRTDTALGVQAELLKASLALTNTCKQTLSGQAFQSFILTAHCLCFSFRQSVSSRYLDRKSLSLPVTLCIYILTCWEFFRSLFLCYQPGQLSATCRHVSTGR